MTQRKRTNTRTVQVHWMTASVGFPVVHCNTPYRKFGLAAAKLRLRAGFDPAVNWPVVLSAPLHCNGHAVEQVKADGVRVPPPSSRAACAGRVICIVTG